MKKNYDLSILCYIGLVFLFILLLLPPMLRLFGKDLYVKKEEEKKKDEVVILTCDKQDENINSTFLNGNPQVLEYRIKGDHSVSVSDEKAIQDNELGDENDAKEDKTVVKEENETEEVDITSFIELIRPLAKIEYNSDSNVTLFKVKVTDLRELSVYNKIFNSIENQQGYFVNQEFSCQKTNYS